MCAVCSECSLNFVAGQVFVGACSIGFFSDLYYQDTNVAGYIVFALVCMCLYVGGIEGVKCIHPNEVLACKKKYVNFGDVLV